MSPGLDLVRLSWPSKMPCPTWGTTAWDTCPGHNNAQGTPMPVCQMCYARDGHYRHANTKQLRHWHEDDWRHADWVRRMISSVRPHTYFRWFDSGDLYHPQLAHKILSVAKATRLTRHWLPTLSYRVQKIRPFINAMAKLSNMRVRRSSGSVLGAFRPGHHGSTVYRPSDGPPDGTFACPAHTQNDHCGDCRACWDKDVKVIAYPARGRMSRALYKQHDAKLKLLW